MYRFLLGFLIGFLPAFLFYKKLKKNKNIQNSPDLFHEDTKRIIKTLKLFQEMKEKI